MGFRQCIGITSYGVDDLTPESLSAIKSSGEVRVSDEPVLFDDALREVLALYLCYGSFPGDRGYVSILGSLSRWGVPLTAADGRRLRAFDERIEGIILGRVGDDEARDATRMGTIRDRIGDALRTLGEDGSIAAPGGARPDEAWRGAVDEVDSFFGTFARPVLRDLEDLSEGPEPTCLTDALELLRRLLLAARRADEELVAAAAGERGLSLGLDEAREAYLTAHGSDARRLGHMLAILARQTPSLEDDVAVAGARGADGPEWVSRYAELGRAIAAWEAERSGLPDLPGLGRTWPSPGDEAVDPAADERLAPALRFLHELTDRAGQRFLNGSFPETVHCGRVSIPDRYLDGGQAVVYAFAAKDEDGGAYLYCQGETRHLGRLADIVSGKGIANLMSWETPLVGRDGSAFDWACLLEGRTRVRPGNQVSLDDIEGFRLEDGEEVVVSGSGDHFEIRTRESYERAGERLRQRLGGRTLEGLLGISNDTTD